MKRLENGRFEVAGTRRSLAALMLMALGLGVAPQLRADTLNVAADAQTVADSPADAEELAKQKRAERKAKRKAQCLAVNVGKPKDC